MPLTIGVLGPIEALRDGSPLALAGQKQRLLLALLVAHLGRPVSRGVLLEALWPERPPGDAEHALDVQISRLRKVLGAPIERDAEGYVLARETVELDATRFERLREQAARAEPERAAALLREALGAWRGPAFGELGGEASLRAEAAALDEARLAATEARIDAELELGLDGELVPELQRLVAAEPLRERLRGQLMVALYRSSRQADALAAYDDARRTLGAELGLAPSEGLQTLQRQILEQEPSLRPPRASRPSAARRPRRGRRVIVGAVATALAAIVVVIAAAGGGGKDASAARLVGPRALGFVDQTGRRLLGALRLDPALLNGEGGMAFTEDRRHAWLTTPSGALLQVDRRTYRLVRSVGLGFPPSGIAIAGGSVWVSSSAGGELVALDPGYATVQQRVRLPDREGRITHMSTDGRSLWMAQGGNRVLRVDAVTGDVVGSVAVPGATDVSASGDQVWVAGGSQGTLVRIDPQADAILKRVPLGPYICCVAVGGGAAWALGYGVWKVDADGQIRARIPIDGDGANLVYGAGALWVAEGISGKVSRIDPRTDGVRSFSTRGATMWAVPDKSGVAVVTDRLPRDVLAGISGPVARIELADDGLQPDDPALPAYADIPLWREQLLDATCAKVTTRARVAGAAGRILEPELAAALPSPSQDRRRWRMTIRSGYRFSPPSNAPVTARTVAATIERALSPQMGPGAPASRVLPSLAGLGAYRAGHARHIAGVTVRGAVVTLRFTRPVRDLPARLADRSLCVVPLGTPASRTTFVSRPLPAAGPYFLAAHYGGVQALLRRNPNYRGPRPARFAAFGYEMAIPLPSAADRVERGRADYVAGFDPALGSRSEVARRLGPAQEGTPPRWSLTPLGATHVLTLDTRRALFAQATVRRAAAIALDRNELAALLDGIPSTPRGARAARARRLLGGRPVRGTLRGCPDTACRAATAAVRRQLARAGIHVRLVRSGPADARLELTPAAPRRPSTIDIATAAVGELFSERIGCRVAPPWSFGVDLARLCPRT